MSTAEIFAIAIPILYFLPIFVAWVRKAPNRPVIAVINLFLGWTFIGWVVALAMAYAQPKKKDEHV